MKSGQNLGTPQEQLKTRPFTLLVPFHVNIAKFLRTPILKNIGKQLLLKILN